MALLASDVLTRVREQLVDQDPTVRWTDAELLRHISDAQRTIAAMQPDTANKIAIVTLAAGTRQTLPADGTQLLGVTRNIAPDGVTPLRAVRIVRRDIMDDQNPNWHADARVAVVYNYIFDPMDQRAYYVYPPSNGTTKLEINYAFAPAEVLTGAAALAYGDTYITPITDYVLYRAHMKDSDFAAGQNKANAYLDAFKMFMQGVDASEAETSPNLQTMPFNPGVKGAAK